MVSWIMTLIEIAVGYWLTTIGYPIAGGILIGLAMGSKLSRIAAAIRANRT